MGGSARSRSVKAGEPDELRLRVGKWRVRLQLEYEMETLYVLRIGLRDEIYD